MKAMQASDQGDERHVLEMQKQATRRATLKYSLLSFFSSLAKSLACGSALEILAHIPTFVVILIVKPVGPKNISDKSKAKIPQMPQNTSLCYETSV